MLLTSLTDEEFLRHAQAEHDTLLSSAVETELLRRFVLLVDHAQLAESFSEAMGEFGLDASVADLKARLEQPGEWADKKIGEVTDLLDSKDVTDHAELGRLLDMGLKATDHDLETPEALDKALADLRRISDAFNDLAEPLKQLAELTAA